MIVVHVTHEAVEKIGGIGAVISGLVTSDAYGESVSRTILLGPLLTTDRPVNLRLGRGGKIIYSSIDGVGSEGWSEKFRPIERTYDVGIVYGTRPLAGELADKSLLVEVLLVDVFHANRNRLNLFKTELFKKFSVPSDRFEDVWEYEQYIRLAEPGFEALKVIGADAEQMVILAHEYMGMPTALKAVLDGSHRDRTVFYAHEVASARPVVEDTAGHDTMFYNVLAAAAKEGRTMEEVFPSVFDNYKHALVKASRYCDHIFAVGDYVKAELQFLDRRFRTVDIDVVYNGIPASETTLDAKHTGRARMQAYASSLFGFHPTWIFTHVARPVLSKGIWRDLRVLHAMEPLLKQRDETAVYYMLGTLVGQRRIRDIRQMERDYGWPVAHEKGYPDLACGEEVLGEMFDYFNREHEAVRVVLVNQWGWEPEACGRRMPEDMTFMDMRCGTDVEFGLSVYEPFGISQLEPLSFGALCVVSNVCGCAGFARSVAGDQGLDDCILVADFLRVDGPMTVDQLLEMPTSQRDQIESAEAEKLAGLIAERLPRDEQTMLRRIERGRQLGQGMSWQHVVRDYFLPALGRAVGED